MKKIVYLIVALTTLAFTACTPLEDVYDELDAAGQETPIVGSVEFTMSDDDYADTDNEDVEEAKAFQDYEQAVELIPTMLSNKYPVWGEGSSALVSFAYDRLNTISNVVEYEMVDTDYTDILGLRFPNFGSDHANEAKGFVGIKYPDAKRGDLVELTYKFWNGSVNVVTAKFVYTDEWLAPTELTSTDYSAMGQRFSNFDDFEEAEFKIGRYLGTLPASTYAKEGEVKDILYTYTYKDDNNVRQFEDILVFYTFDGSSWNLNSNTIQFGFENGKWVPDNTIKYSFKVDDYTTVYDALKDVVGYEAAASNLDRFGNFGRPTSDSDLNATEPSNNSRWNNLMMFRALPVVLNKLDPDALDGQKYVVTVSIYNGSPGFESFSLIKENGEWIEKK